MEIIKLAGCLDTNLSILARKNFGGFISGLVRVTLGVAQVGINSIGLLAYPVACCCLSDKYHFTILSSDLCIGIFQIALGVFEFIPGTSLILRMIDQQGDNYACQKSNQVQDDIDSREKRHSQEIDRVMELCPALSRDGADYVLDLVARYKTAKSYENKPSNVATIYQGYTSAFDIKQAIKSLLPEIQESQIRQSNSTYSITLD